jgi:hypothetical protein
MDQEKENNPPILKSWKQMYLFVFLNLTVTILIFYIITRILQ